MQAKKRHIPVVGIIGIIVIAASGGGIYYYQFVLTHAMNTYVPVHRLVFMTSQIVEGSANGHGFTVYGESYLNQSTLPNFNSTAGPTLAGVKLTNYTVSSSTIVDARVGDTITFYIRGINDTTTMCGSNPCQVKGIPGHGFAISGPGPVIVQNGGILPCGTPNCSIPFNGWYSLTITVQTSGTYTYFCYIPCSPLHGIMEGSIQVS